MSLILINPALAVEDIYGPVNLLKTMPTPFSPKAGSELNSLDFDPARTMHRSLGNLLVSSRLYLPGRMVLGKPAEFTIKGRPGSHVALAMADKNSGAKPIYGHNIRLGADRHVVSVGEIPESGILSLAIETPVEGDLIGQYLFFEAAVWSRADFSDLEIAQPVTSEGQIGISNGVQVAAEPDERRGIRIIPNSTPPTLQIQKSGQSLDSGRP